MLRLVMAMLLGLCACNLVVFYSTSLHRECDCGSGTLHAARFAAQRGGGSGSGGSPAPPPSQHRQAERASPATASAAAAAGRAPGPAPAASGQQQQQQQQPRRRPPPMYDDRDFGVQHFSFLGRYRSRHYQANVWLRAVCPPAAAAPSEGPARRKRARLVVSVNTAPDLWFREGRSFYYPVTPHGWFDDDAAPALWFRHHATGDRVAVYQHTRERDMDDKAFFVHDWSTECWFGHADLDLDAGYTLHMEGSERFFQALVPGEASCPPPHPMFWQLPLQPQQQQQQSGEAAAAAAADEGVPGAPPMWVVSIGKVAFAPELLRYMVQQQLRHHRAIGMAGLLLLCDPFVAAAVAADPALAGELDAGRLVVWVWGNGGVDAKPHAKQYWAYNCVLLAAHGTPALVGAWDLDEFLVLPGRVPAPLLAAPGGCLHGVWHRGQAVVRTRVAVALAHWAPGGAGAGGGGELARWPAHGDMADAVDALGYFTADQAWYGFKALLSPNIDSVHHCHHYYEAAADVPGNHSNYVDHGCAHLVHFVNWFEDRVQADPAVGGTSSQYQKLGAGEVQRLLRQPIDPEAAAAAAGGPAAAPLRGFCGSAWPWPARAPPLGARAAARGPCAALATAGDVAAAGGLPLAAPRRLRAVSVTLAARPVHNIVGDALRSAAPAVDASLLVFCDDMPEGATRTLLEAHRAAGGRLVAHRLANCGPDARGASTGRLLGAALEAAARLPADWALLLAPDERLNVAGEGGLPRLLADAEAAGARQLNCLHAELGYFWPTALQLPGAAGGNGGGANGSLGDFLHDLYSGPPGVEEADEPRCVVSRLAKDESWPARRGALEARLLDPAAASAANGSGAGQRAWFGLGEARAAQGLALQAVEAWRACALLPGGTLGHLCAFRAAEALSRAGATNASAEVAERALELHGPNAEVSWHAAFSAYYGGRYEDARRLARRAAAEGCWRGGACRPRRRIDYARARWDAPYEILHYAAAQLGDAAAANAAQADAAAATAAAAAEARTAAER